MITRLFALFLLGCGGAMPTPADIKPISDEASSKLARCRAIARNTYYVDKRGLDQALADYEACKRQEGVQ